jgi:hypothetical protein
MDLRNRNLLDFERRGFLRNEWKRREQQNGKRADHINRIIDRRPGALAAMCDRPPGLSPANARGAGATEFPPFYERRRQSARVLSRNHPASIMQICLPAGQLASRVDARV